jgi:hypothetical protein
MKALFFSLTLFFFAVSVQAENAVYPKENPSKCIANNDRVFWQGINTAREEIYTQRDFKIDSVVFFESVNQINSCTFFFSLFVKGEYFASAEIVLLKSGWRVQSRKLLTGNDEAIW